MINEIFAVRYMVTVVEYIIIIQGYKFLKALVHYLSHTLKKMQWSITYVIKMIIFV